MFNWNEINPSEFKHERDGLNFLRDALTCHKPALSMLYAWSNFEFIDHQGNINEVDLALLTPHGFFLIELKDWRGNISGDSQTWYLDDGQRHAVDNPRLLINRKAKRFASLLKSQIKQGAPYVQELVFLHNPSVRFDQLAEHIARAVHGRATILQPLTRPGTPPTLNFSNAKAIAAAFHKMGLVPMQQRHPGAALSHKRRGDYILQNLLHEEDRWQEWNAIYPNVSKLRRRLVLYPYRDQNNLARSGLDKAIRRAFEVLDGLDHPGILKPIGHEVREHGPALIYDAFPNERRFDLYLKEKHGQLNHRQRLNLVRRVFDILAYAHENNLYHRALTPTSILVVDHNEAEPRLKISHWASARRDTSSSLTSSGDPADLLDDPALVYLAPEVDQDLADPALLDVFGLGALTWFIFTAKAPATTVAQRNQILRDHGCLALSQALDAVPPILEQIVRETTSAATNIRLNIGELRDLLDQAAQELRYDRLATVSQPASANPGDILDGGLTVLKHLGRGASAVVYLVRKGDQDLVLKLADTPEHNERIEREYQVLRRLSQRQVIATSGIVDVGAHKGIFLEHCNRGNLADYLSQNAPLDGPIIHHLGDQLLKAITYLENEGVDHRDVKPENIGLIQAENESLPQLKVLDFSLAGVQPENLLAGTRAYLDPFLGRGMRQRWDRHAETYAVTLTLHKLACGVLPRWSADGAPAVTDGQHLVDPQSFPPHLRQSLAPFFARAFETDHRQRFSSILSLHEAWRNAFQSAANADVETPRLSSESPELQPASALVDIALSPATQAVLRRANLHTVADFIGQSLDQLSGQAGVGRHVRIELGILYKKLSARFANIAHPPAAPRRPNAPANLDSLQGQLLDTQRTDEAGWLKTFLGLDESGAMPRLGAPDLARTLGQPLDRVDQALERARQRWKKKLSTLTILRTAMTHALKQNSLLCLDQLLDHALRLGSTREGKQREQLARAALRAASWVESGREHAHWCERSVYGKILLLPRENFSSQQHEDQVAYVRQLAQKVDQLAELDPLPSPERVEQELAQLPAPGELHLQAEQRLQLAVVCAQSALRNSQGEIYPRSFSAERALAHARGTLLGLQSISREDLLSRIKSRYPGVEGLPDLHELARLLTRHDLPCQWDAQLFEGKGGIRFQNERNTSTLTSPRQPPMRPNTASQGIPERLQRELRQGGFLAVGTSIQRHQQILGYLRKLEVSAHDADALILRHMRAAATAGKIAWTTVLQADARPSTSIDGQNLRRRIIEPLRTSLIEELSSARKPLLLYHLGLFARYQMLDLLTQLRDRCGRANGPAAILLLLPTGLDENPKIGTTPLPILSPSQWLPIPESWPCP